MKKKISILFLIAIATISLLACSSQGDISKEESVIPVTIYSNTEEFTEFDYWLMNNVGISAAPAHVIIKDNKITNFADYEISYEELKTIYDTESMSLDLWQAPLDEKYFLKDFDIIILKRVNCDACKEQEEKYESAILEGFKDKRILIYYIASEQADCPDGCD